MPNIGKTCSFFFKDPPKKYFGEDYSVKISVNGRTEEESLVGEDFIILFESNGMIFLFPNRETKMTR